VKLFEAQAFPNLLDHVTLTSEGVAKQIAHYTLEFPQLRNPKVERGIAFPVFLNPFYKFVYFNNSVLSQANYFDSYLKENADFFEKNKFNQTTIAGLKARIYRTYPSLVRDLHFCLFIKERMPEAKVIYNRKLDVEEGIDILIVRNGINYGVNIYTDTERSQSSRERKPGRHIKFANVVDVDLPVVFKGSVQCGLFFLCGEREFEQLTKKINL
jgi:hypothetical protein